MRYTPVELKHVKLARGLFGYRRDALDTLLEDVADSFETVWSERGELEDRVHALEKQLEELKRREELLTGALVAAEQTAAAVREQARREAELIVAEAHHESRSVMRGAQGEHARLAADARRIEALLRAALGMVEESAVQRPVPDEGEPETQELGEPEPQKLESWPRRDDTREFPRVRPLPGLPSEPEAQAG